MIIHVLMPEKTPAGATIVDGILCGASIQNLFPGPDQEGLARQWDQVTCPMCMEKMVNHLSGRLDGSV